jgi:hypothetical protein
MLYRLQEKTGLPCNPHTFGRTFASNLPDMVVRYTRSLKIV